jgi:hypothetical protein
MHTSTEIQSRPIQRRIERAQAAEQDEGDDEDCGMAVGAAAVLSILFWIAALLVLAFKYPAIAGYCLTLLVLGVFFFGCLRAANR